MRSTKELLQILLTELESEPGRYAGLCSLINHCEFAYDTHPNSITFEEAWLLQPIVDNNRPSVLSSWWRFKRYIINDGYRNYYWKPYDAAPRIKWLKEQIKLHS